MTTPVGGSGSAPTPLSRALETIRMLRAQLAARQGRQPIAIVGIGLRLPGAIDTLETYWSALAEGRELVKTIPPQRAAPFTTEWESLPQRGGFLDEVLGFDAEYFGISPREARALDPQHRLLLEVTAEALADAALPPQRLHDATTGLYVGITHQDYRDWEPSSADAYWATGNGHCFAAGRVAYVMGANRAGHRARHRLLVVAGRSPPSGVGAATRRMRRSARRRSQPDPVTEVDQVAGT